MENLTVFGNKHGFIAALYALLRAGFVRPHGLLAPVPLNGFNGPGPYTAAYPGQ